MATKFPTRNVTFFAKEQTARGTPAAVVAASALTVTSATLSRSTEIDTLEWLGSAADRGATQVVVDDLGSIAVEFPLYTSGTAGTAPAWDSLMGCANATKTLVAATSVTYTNAALLDKYVTAVLNYKAAEVATEKRVSITDAKAIVDISFSLKQRATMAVTLQGTPVAPSQVAALAPNYGQQRNTVLPPVILGNLPTATVQGAGVCVTDFKATNFFGVKLDRQALVCETGWLQSIERNEVSITVVEQEATASLVPESLLNSVDSTTPISLVLGTVAGKIATISLPDLKITKIDYGELNGLRTQTMTFTNTGSASLILT